MSEVSTVRGPVDVADLGPTYMHEHIFVLTADVQWHYLHIQDEVLPYAREHGVTEEQIAIMLTANPRRLFGPAR